MNNNRGNNNNRRRGRGNRQGNGGGSGQQLNRIDSRARGNAPQMLEKYRKLASDAHLNGDRVQAEYYLQFADHYFRVIADQRVRQEEQRTPRSDRWQEGEEGSGEDSGEYTQASDFPNFDQPTQARREERAPREDRGPREERAPREERGQREERAPREERALRRTREEAQEAPVVSEVADEVAVEGEASIFEPAENPFVRENRASRGLRPRRDDGRQERRPRRDRDEDDAPAGLDASILPPAINSVREEAVAEAPAAEEAPAPRKRAPRKPKAAAEEAAE